MLEHGGRLRRAASQYQIALPDWLDLSTGLAPYAWPIAAVPVEAWQRLPETDDGLEEAARRYYGARSVLPVCGSQAAIQAMPALFPDCRVGIVEPCYAEHRFAWERAGFSVRALSEQAAVDAALDQLDVLVVVNPNNPTGRLIEPDTLLGWRARLADRGGCLIVDEAFVDPTPHLSLAQHAHEAGLVVLRSLGKFFGLGGARVGFVLAADPLLNNLAERLGPWTISGPTRHVARQALADAATQQRWRQRMSVDGDRLRRVLTSVGLTPAGGCALFQWLPCDRAAQLHDDLARRGILTRLFTEPAALRIGLPADEAGWARLQQALISVAGAH